MDLQSTDEIRRHRVRPLWVASVRNHLPIVKLLVACARHLHERGLHLDLSDWGPPRAILPLVYSRDGASATSKGQNQSPSSATLSLPAITNGCGNCEHSRHVRVQSETEVCGCTGSRAVAGGGSSASPSFEGPRRRRYRQSGFVFGDNNAYLSRLNRQSDTLSTPVRSACFDNNTEIVDYLLTVGTQTHYDFDCLVLSGY